MNIKHELKQSLPSSIYLSENEKITIRNKVRHTHSPKFSLKPTIITILTVLLIGILVFPTIETMEQAKEATVEKITIQNIPYDSLIKSTYIDETKELIYSNDNGIYAHKMGENQLLADTSETGRVYDFVATDKWLVWQELQQNKTLLHIINRKTNEQIVKEGEYISFMIYGNELIYNGWYEGELDRGYYVLNLITQNEIKLHELNGEGSYSWIARQYNLLVIPETVATDNKKETYFYIYDLNKKQLVSQHVIPYENVSNVTFVNDKIYAEFWNKNNKGILGYLDIKTRKFTKMDTPAFNEFAIHDNILALSVRNGDTDTVKLYKVAKDKLISLNNLNVFKERLVKPRFTANGSLVLNGEGIDRSMYVLHFK